MAEGCDICSVQVFSCEQKKLKDISGEECKSSINSLSCSSLTIFTLCGCFFLNKKALAYTIKYWGTCGEVPHSRALPCVRLKEGCFSIS